MSARPKSSHPLYKSWNDMKQRCYNPRRKEYGHYGGRGIRVCERWRESFLNFLADMGERPSGLTLDRIDNDGDYEPENCRWATMAEQNTNKSQRYQGIELEVDGRPFPSVTSACRAFGLNFQSVFYSINGAGMTPTNAIKHHLRRLSAD